VTLCLIVSAPQQPSSQMRPQPRGVVAVAVEGAAAAADVVVQQAAASEPAIRVRPRPEQPLYWWSASIS
jgi:hypothetical protein